MAKKPTEKIPLVSPDKSPEMVSDVAPEPDGYDHTVLHGVDSIVSDAVGFERTYHIKVGGRRYVHVGTTPAGRWIYRPD